MSKKQTHPIQSWIGALLFLGVTGLHAWYIYGFIPLAGVIFLSFIGGLLLYYGLKKILSAVLPGSSGGGTLLAGILLTLLGSLTLLPGWPADILVNNSMGWAILEERSRVLDKALYEEKDLLVKKIAWAGLGDSEPRDSFGNPLIDDAEDPALLKALLDGGLDPDARDEGGTTLLMRTYDEEITRVLLEAGADPNARDENGRTPLMYVSDGNLDRIRVLADHGADVNDMDDFGRTVGDWLGEGPDLDNVLREFAPLGVRRSENLDFLSHARRDWLDQTNVPDGLGLTASALLVDGGEAAYGEQVELQIRLTNDSDTDRVVDVEASINVAALFVSASHEGKVTNPYQAQLDQEIGWPFLALPAQSSGVLNMNIIIRDNWDAGDLSVDVIARNVLTYEEDEAIFLNLYEPLSEAAYTEGSFVWYLLVLLLIPLPLIVWVWSWKKKGGAHPLTRMSGRFVAAVFTILFAQITYTLVLDLVKPYTKYQASEAEILDQRFYLQHSRSTDSQGRSSTTIHKMPIVSARYEALGSEVVSIAPSSFAYFRQTALNDVVTCWYDPDNPEVFTLDRSFGVFSIIGICISFLVTLVLGWFAFRKRSEVAA